METANVASDQKFAFIERLAADLSKGGIELPSFPDVVIRVRKALENEDHSTADLVRIISAEPILAARLLTIANSAALKPSGDEITDLNMAVARVGRGMIRSTAMTFALAQLRTTRKLELVRKHLEDLWNRSSHVAALCYVLAKHYTKLNADEAMFVGLLHGVGEMYILVQAEATPELFSDASTLQNIRSEWGAQIGRSIVESWGLSEYVASAVGEFRETDRSHDGEVDYTDILILAHLLFGFVSSDDDTELQLEDVSAWSRMRIETADLINVLQKSDEQIRSLRHALRG